MFSCKIPVEQLILSNSILLLLFVLQNFFVLTKLGKNGFCQMKGENCPQLYCFNLPSSPVLPPSPSTKATFPSALLPHRIHHLCVSPIPGEGSLSTCVCFVLCPGKCSGASLCSISHTSVLVSEGLAVPADTQAVWEGGCNSTGSSLHKGVWLQMLWSCCTQLPAFQQGDFSLC